MSRDGVVAWQRLSSFLRIRGDVPRGENAVSMAIQLSPRIWRCPTSAKLPDSIIGALSMHMEISLHRARLNAIRLYFLHARGDISPCICAAYFYTLHRHGALNTAFSILSGTLVYYCICAWRCSMFDIVCFPIYDVHRASLRTRRATQRLHFLDIDVIFVEYLSVETCHKQ